MSDDFRGANYLFVTPKQPVKCTQMYSVVRKKGETFIFSARQHAERAICYRPSVRLSVRLSVCLSVCHTGGSVKNG